MTTWKPLHSSRDRELVVFLGWLCWLWGAAAVIAASSRAQDPFVDAVVSLDRGANGGFGELALPDVVLGAPRGAGQIEGSFDVVSLGVGGSIVLRFDPPVLCDGAGPDLTVFENAFHVGSPSGPLFTELGFVAVSQDGLGFVEFPHDAGTGAGLAGRSPVLSHPDNGIDPLDPAVSGGDSFDLADVGMEWAAYVRITDVAGAIPDVGDMPQFSVPPGAGFDLDAVAALHACDPRPTGMPSATPSPTATPGLPTPTATFRSAPSHDAVVVPRRPARLRIRDGDSVGKKRLRVKVRNADAAGELPIRLTATGCTGVDVAVSFDRHMDPRVDSAIVRAGKTRSAIVSVEASSTAITTPDRHQPAACVLIVSAQGDLSGNVDPTPCDNAIEVLLGVVDLNDVD